MLDRTLNMQPNQLPQPFFRVFDQPNGRADDAIQFIQRMVQDLVEHVLLAGNVVIQPGLGHSDRLGNIADGRSSVALFDHQLRSGAKDIRSASWRCFGCGLQT